MGSFAFKKVHLVFRKETDIVQSVSKVVEKQEIGQNSGEKRFSGLSFTTIRLRDFIFYWRLKKMQALSFAISESPSLSYFARGDEYCSSTVLLFELIDYALKEKKPILFFGHTVKQEFRIRHNIKLFFEKPLYGNFISYDRLHVYKKSDILALLSKTGPRIIFMTPKAESWLGDLKGILPSSVFYLTRKSITIFTSPRKRLHKVVLASEKKSLGIQSLKQMFQCTLNPINWFLSPFLFVLARQLSNERKGKAQRQMK